MANSNKMTEDQLVAKLDQIATTRQEWEQNEYQASNKILYRMLGKCFKIVEQVSESEALKDHLAAQLKLKGIACNKNTSLETRVVRWVFGDCKNRAFLYVSVLQTAKSAKPKDQDMAAWIEAEKGLENISRSKSGESPKVIHAKRIKEATLHFKTADPICTIESGHEQLAPIPDEENLFSVALIRNDGSGKSEVVFGTNNPTLISAILANAGRGMVKTKSEQPDAPEPTAADDEASSADDINVTDGGIDTDSGIESDIADAGQETEPQGDTKPDEDEPDLATGTGNLCAETMHIELPLATKERLAALAA